MCGIVGLLLKNEAMRPDLGKLMLPMFRCMAERGPDSAGLALFHEPVPDGSRRFAVHAPACDYDWESFAVTLESKAVAPCRLQSIGNHASFSIHDGVAPETVKGWLAAHDPRLHLLSAGRAIEIFKDEGPPEEIAARYGFADMSASHCVGHTRMATESAVSPAHAHPFTAGDDFCLVHNGSLSNPYMIRRKLEARGLSFETDNDTEAACRLVEWRLRGEDDVAHALNAACDEMDGFYTLLIGTASGMMLVRDPMACKPAVVTETDDYVAVSSEFRALAHLPGIAGAKTFEPRPREIYAWTI